MKLRHPKKSLLLSLLCILQPSVQEAVFNEADDVKIMAASKYDLADRYSKPEHQIPTSEL